MCSASHGAHEVEEDQGRPDATVDHLRPVVCAKPAAQRKNGRAEDGGQPAASQLARESVGEDGGQVVNEDEIPVQIDLLDPAVAERHREEQPVERIDDSGLRLADQRLTQPVIWVPEWEMSGVPLACLELEPGKHLQGTIQSGQPGELIREHQFPVKTNNQKGKHDSRLPAGDVFQRWWFWIELVVFSHPCIA